MKNVSTKWLWWFAASFAVAGLIDSQLPITNAFFSGSAVVHMIIIGFLTFGWVKATRERVCTKHLSRFRHDAVRAVAVPVVAGDLETHPDCPGTGRFKATG
jgi:hypothetical protein